MRLVLTCSFHGLSIEDFLRPQYGASREPPGCSGGEFSALLRIEDWGSPQRRGLWKLPPQNESPKSISCTCGILRQGVWISRCWVTDLKRP